MKIILTILFVVFGFIVNAQTRPAGTPTQFNTGWSRWGYMQPDSGLINGRRDTLNFFPRFSGTMIMRPQDRSLYWYDSLLLKWNKILKQGDVTNTTASNGLNKVVDDIRLGGNLTQETSINGQSLWGLSGDSLLSLNMSTIYPNNFIGPPYYIRNTISSTEGEQGISITSRTNNLTPDTLVNQSQLLLIPESVYLYAIDSDSTNVFQHNVSNTSVQGRFGIGTQSPGAKLDVNGTGRFLDTLTATTMGNSDSSNRVASTALLKRLISILPTSSAINNTNIGSGFRILNDPSAQTMRTLFSNNTGAWDSTSNANGLTYKVDTTVIATKKYVDSNDSYFRDRTVGRVFTDLFNRSFLGSSYTVTSTDLNVALTGTKMTIKRATNGGFANYVTKTDTVFGWQRMNVNLKFVIDSAGGGLGIQYLTTVVPSINNNLQVLFVAYSGATPVGRIDFYSNGNLIQTGTKILSFAIGDTIQLSLFRNNSQFSATATNLTKRLQAQEVYTFPLLIGSYTFSIPNLSTLGILASGGNQSVYEFSVTSFNKKFQKTVFVGNSISTGYGASQSNMRFPDRAYNNTDQLEVSAGGFEKSADAIRRLPEIAAMFPQTVIVELGVNDGGGGGVTAPAFQANIDSIVHYLQDRGIRVVLTTVIPTTVSNVTEVAYNAAINTVATNRGCVVVDIYGSALNNGSGGMAALYDGGDGIHPNDIGHWYIASLEKPALFIDTTAGNALFAARSDTLYNFNMSVVEPGSNRLGVWPKSSMGLQFVTDNGNKTTNQVVVQGGTTTLTNSQLRVGTFEFQSAFLNNAFITENLFFDGSFKRRQTGYGTIIQPIDGSVLFSNVNTGTAGSAASAGDIWGTIRTDVGGQVLIGGDIAATGTTGANAIFSAAGSLTLNTRAFLGTITSFATPFNAGSYTSLPTIGLNNSAAAAGQKKYMIQVGSNNFRISLLNDAESGSLDFFKLTQTASVIDSLTVPTLTVNQGNLRINTNSLSTDVSGRRVYNNGSWGGNKDSITTITSITSQFILVQDTATGADLGKFKKILSSNLGFVATASNGLTVTGTDVAMGGNFTGNTTIGNIAQDFGLTINRLGTSNATTLSAVSSTGNAINATSTSGVALLATTNTGSYVGGFTLNPATTNTIDEVIRVSRNTSGTPAAGLGGYIGFTGEVSDNSLQDMGRLSFAWTDVTLGTRTSNFTVNTTNSGSSAARFTVKGSGQLQGNGYGSGTFTGTPTQSAQFDASGNIIEGPVLASSTFSPALTNTANISSSATFQGQYLRVGNTVTLSGQFTIDPVATTTLTQLTFTVPIASTLGAAENLSGTASDGNLSAKIYSNGTGSGILEFNSVGTTATTWTYTLTYTIN